MMMAYIYSHLWLLCMVCEYQSVLTAMNKSEVRRDVSLVLRFRKIIDRFLQTNNCTKDYHLNEGKPLVFDFQAWEKEENLVITMANFLTSMWRYKNNDNFSLVENEATMYSLVRSNARSSPFIYGSVICFDSRRFRIRDRFCPYAFKDKTVKNRTRVFDLGANNNYLNKSLFMWWEVGRKNGLELEENKLKSDIEYYDTDLLHVNASYLQGNNGRFFNVSRRYITSSDGVWTDAYYDCFGGKTWMMTYLAPFYDETDTFLGVISIDIDLDTIEINQCDFPNDKAIQEAKQKWTQDNKKTKILSFYGSHRCKNQSTECVHVSGSGFSAGNYRCVCRKGYYFPKPDAPIKSFDGSEILRISLRNRTLYNATFDCLPCRKGCEVCVDDTPCVYGRNTPLLIVLLVLNETVKALAIALAIFIFVYRERKLIKASSPVFMEIIALGIIMMYFEVSLGYLEPSVAVCIAQSWLYNVGFMLAFGSLLLKTWRVVVIFRLRSAKMIELTDIYLLKYLAMMVSAVIVYLVIWTWTSTQAYQITKTSSDLKYKRCVRGWFSNAMVLGEVMFLIWGVWLCIRVRKAPSAYNESKYIAWCIYNTIFVTVLVSLLRLLLDNFHNPDVSYTVDFLSTHVVATIMLILLFVSKIIHLRKFNTEHTNSSNSTCATDLRKSPFRLNRLVNGSLVPEIEEERGTRYSLETENIALREEIRSLNAQLAVYENKEARRRKQSSFDDTDRSQNNSPRRTSTEKETNEICNGASAEGISMDYSNVFMPNQKSGSLIENIKNSGKTNSDTTYSTMPLEKGVSEEAMTVISRVSDESQE